MIDNTENVVSVNEETQAPEVENQEIDNQVENETEASTNTDAAENDNDEDEIPEKYQRKIGEIISKERKRMQAKYQANASASMNQPQMQQNQQAPDGMIFDKQIKQYVAVDSVVGQIALREQLAEEQRLIDKNNQEILSKKQRDAELIDEVNEGFNNHKYPNYVNAIENFQQYGSDSLFYSLEGVDNKAAVVNYFADKKGEVQRLARLSPAKQLREFIRIEDLVSPRKKLVTQAQAPIKKVMSDGSKAGVRPQDMSIDQINQYYEEKYNRRG